MPASNALVMKEINFQLVRRLLKNLRFATRQQLALSSGLSIVTVAGILEQMVADDEAREVDLIPSAGGRPSRQFEFNADHSLVLVAFALESQGRDTVSVRVANLYGHCLDAEDEPQTPQSLGAFEPLFERMLAKHPRIQALGFGLPGIEMGGRIVATDYVSLVGTSILDHFRQKYGLPVHFENDVNAAAVGWAKRFPDQDQTSAYLYFPRKYPPGAGIRIEGRLWRGRRAYAGEVAHMPLGIPWGEPSLYADQTQLCTAIARVVVGISCVVNPDTVVLHGEFLTPGHLMAIETECHRMLPTEARPLLVLSDNFTLDFQMGLTETTLALLEPRHPLSVS